VDAWLESLDPDPRATLGAWLAEAREVGFDEPEAAALATATREGAPSVRMVLVRGTNEHDLRFYTSHESRKAAELAANPAAALVFYWGPPLRRQVRVEGRVERLSDEESIEYFRTRARESRLGAWASPQSRPLADRGELDRLYADVEERFGPGGDVPLTTEPGTSGKTKAGRGSGSRRSGSPRPYEGGASALFVYRPEAFQSR
jgi:pyridoxamine 5'-phosphate oxidase